MTENKIFLLYDKYPIGLDRIIAVREKNEECARAAASCLTEKYDERYRAKRDLSWLDNKKSICSELPVNGEPIILFYRDLFREICFLKGNLV